MKSKLFKILGVVAVVAMLASTLVALPASALSNLSVSVSSSTNKINNVGNYMISFTNATQLAGTTGGTITFTGAQTFIVTNTSAADQVFVSGAVGALTPLVGGTAVWTAVTGGCIISFSGAGAGTATFTGTAPTTTGNYVKSFGNATVSTGTGAITTVAALDTITVTFPSGFTVSGGVPAASISISPGYYTAPGSSVPAWYISPVLASASWTSSTALSTVTFTLQQGDFIPMNDSIIINITSAVTNPGTQGSYTLNLATSKETTAVTSNAFTISNPIIPPVAGIASVFNSAAVPMTQYNDLASAIAYVNTNALSGAVIKLSAGTYSQTAYPSCSLPITIQGTDANAANVILKSPGTWTLSGKTVLIDMVTIDNSTGALTMASTASGAASTISNSFVKGGVLTLNGLKDTLYGDTFTVANGATGVNVTGTAAIVNASTFNVAGTGYGITSAGSTGTTITGSTFLGVAATGQTATGYGVTVTAGTANSIKTSQFSGLATALTVSGGTTSFDSNTVNSCGLASPAYDTIVATVAGTVLTVTNNKINTSLDYIINVNACDPTVNVIFNQFSGNVKNAVNAGSVGDTYLNVTHNYWGGAATPANVTATGTKVTYANALGAAPGASNIASTNTLDATATAGVFIVTIPGAGVVGATALSVNPVTPTLPSSVTVKQYYDVFGIGGTGTTAIDLKFFGTTANPITSSSNVFFYNTAYGAWTDCSKAGTVIANVFANYLEVTILPTTAGTQYVPSWAQVAGMPWALVTTNPSAPGIVTQSSITPATAATGVSVTPSFAWTAIGSSTYEFNLSTDSTFVAANFFSATPTTNGVIVNKPLAYNTVYYWQVRSVDPTSGLKSAWTTGFFTTMLAPVPVVTPAFGATAVSILPNITWPAVTGAASYNFNLSTETTFAAAKVFYTGTSTTNGIAIPKILAWNTTYNWEFQSVDAAGNKSAWTTSFFTTAPQATPTLKPALGAQGVSLTPTFTWDPIPGAVSYEFALAQEIGAVNKFDILDYSNNTPTPGITAQETLLYSTTYNWEYRAVDSTGAKSAWTVSFFTTMDKPAAVTTTASTAVVTTQPTIIITQPTVTQTPITIISTTGTPASPAIPSYLLWAVIAVGAVLVIAVIVLIVRTRRIP